MRRTAQIRLISGSGWSSIGKIIGPWTMGLALLSGLAACRGRPTVQGTAEPAANPEVTLPPDRLFLLETWGAPPSDTTVSLAPAKQRSIVLRHGPPDNTVFAELILPAGALPDSSGPGYTVTLAPRPGTYGITITTTPAFKDGATLRFEYPVHFSAPAAAVAKYGNTARYEAALSIGYQEQDGRFHLLPSTRPAADVLQAMIPGPGVYLVAAPR